MTKQIVAVAMGVVNFIFFYFVFSFLTFNFGGVSGYCYFLSIKNADGSEMCQPIGTVVPEGLHGIVLIVIAGISGIIGYVVYKRIVKEWK